MGMEKEVSSLKAITESLQQILLGDIDISDNIDESNDDCVILQAKLSQLTIQNEKLQKELKDTKLECCNLKTEQEALNNRFQQQEEELSTLHQQVLQKNLICDRLQAEKMKIEMEFENCQKTNNQIFEKLYEKDNAIKQLEENLSNERSSNSRSMSIKDREINQLHHRLKELNISDEVFADSMRYSAKMNKSPMSPLSFNSTSPKLSRRSPLSKHHPSRRKKNYDDSQTRVLYFSDRDMTPAMTSIPKRVGDITLRDFKQYTKKELGNFRFVFKALDPELGTVKEEVFNDEDIVPGWEGKIVAWVEEVLRV